MTRLRGAALVSALAVAAACSAFESDDSTGSSADAGAADASAPDGTTGAADGGPPACALDPGACGERVADARGIRALAANGRWVAWSDGPNVLACSATEPACQPRVLCLAGLVPTSITVAQDELTWAAEQSVYRLTIPASGEADASAMCVRPSTSVMHPGAVAGPVAADATDVIVTLPASGTLYRCPSPAFCFPNYPPVAAKAKGGVAPIAVALDSSRFYWASVNGLEGCARAGGCTSPVDDLRIRFDPAADVVGVAADSAELLWTRQSGSIHSCPSEGCAGSPKTLATGQRAPREIAADAQSIYWINRGDKTVMRCARVGCANPEVVGRTPGEIGLLALSSTHVYFADLENGVIRRVPKSR